jgi:hypothetical protein
VTSGRPVDLSKWDSESPTRTTLDQMTEAIMLDIRALLSTIREGTPPPLYDPPASRRNPPAVAE